MITKLLTQAMRHGNRVVQRINSFSAEGQDSVEAALGAASTDQVVTYAIDVSALAFLFMVCDNDVTVEWNDNAGSQGSISLKAGRPLVWDSMAAYYANPLGATDVTKFYVTNAGDAATLIIDTIYDVTP